MNDWQSGLDTFSDDSDEDANLNDGFDETNPDEVLNEYFSDVEWDFRDIRRTNGETIPVPPSSKCVTAILEVIALNIVRELIDDLGGTFIESSSRQYPDSSLRHVFENNLTALDIKSTRIESDSTISGMTLGSCGVYFSNPKENTPGSRFPYGDYDEHWVVCFAYEWDGDAESENMIRNIETLVGQKWEFAKEASTTNSTNQIVSQTDLMALRNRNPVYDTEEEFEEDWRAQ